MHDVTGEVNLYRSPDGAMLADIRLAGDSFWLSQWQMAEPFGIDVRTVNEHLRNVYASDDPEGTSTIRNVRSARCLN